MMIFKNRIVHFLIIISAILLVNVIHSEIAESANNKQIIIDENLRPGMSLKDAIELLGPPDKMNVSDTGAVVMPYSELGLSIELKSNGTVIEVIHLQSSFKGRFASGLEMGADFQRILSLYNLPDIMTKEIIEYSDSGRIFKLSQGKLTGADLYAGEGSLPQQVPKRAAGKSEGTAEGVRAEVSEDVREEVRQEIREEIREEVHEEVRNEVIEELRKEAREEVREEVVARGRDIVFEDGYVFDLFGFKVKRSHDGIVITEIRSGSVAQHGGLKKGEIIRRASLKGYGKRNIYSVGGLEDILQKAIFKGNKTINILQNGNRYYKVEVPEIN